MQIIHLLWIMYIQTSSASAYCSFLHFLLIYLCSWLAINRNQHLRNATRMVSEFPWAIHWSPELFPIPSLYYLCCYCRIKVTQKAQCSIYNCIQSFRKALETSSNTEKRLKLECHHANKNRSLESPETSRKRIKLQCERTACRHSNVSIHINSFIDKTKQGSDFVCVSCHCLTYRQSVRPCKINLQFLRPSTLGN